MIGVVLGNSTSKQRYNRSGDFVIGCNIPSEDYSIDATVIADVEFVWIIKNNPELVQCPLIVTTTVWEKMKELHLASLHDVVDVITPKNWYTSEHHAALYLTNTMSCDIVHVWGCNSYFTEDHLSLSDQYVISEMDLYLKWKKCWNNVIKDSPETTFVIKR
jgi:hypothetical protein